MKKVLALILALVMAFALCGVAFADTTTLDSRDGKEPGTNPTEENPWTDDGVVAITVNPGQSGTIYYVVVTWETLEFTYQEEGTGVWNPVDHTYSDSTSNEWVANGDTVEGNKITKSNAITIANHSNAAVDVSIEAGEIAGATIEFSADNFTLSSAVGSDPLNLTGEGVNPTPIQFVDISITKTGTIANNATATVTVTIKPGA